MEHYFGTPLIPMVILSIGLLLLLCFAVYMIYLSAKDRYKKREQDWTRRQSRRYHERSKN
jgi:uncharacterized membrane protein